MHESGSRGLCSVCVCVCVLGVYRYNSGVTARPAATLRPPQHNNKSYVTTHWVGPRSGSTRWSPHASHAQRHKPCNTTRTASYRQPRAHIWVAGCGEGKCRARLTMGQVLHALLPLPDPPPPGPGCLLSRSPGALGARLAD